MAAIGLAEAYETDDPDKWSVVATMLEVASRDELSESYCDLLTMLITTVRLWSELEPELAGLLPSEVMRLQFVEHSKREES
jgi:hypothetical protein